MTHISRKRPAAVVAKWTADRRDKSAEVPVRAVEHLQGAGDLPACAEWRDVRQGDRVIWIGPLAKSTASK